MKQTSLFKQFFLLVLLLVASTTGAWAQANEYQLVTDASTLADGDVIIIASSTDDGNHFAMGGANTGNNRKAVQISISSSTIATSVSNGNETVSNANTANASLTKPFEVTLVKSGDNWNLKEVLSDGDVYLNGGYGKTQQASSNNNHLKASEDVEIRTGKYNNGVYSISINSTSYAATIENQNGWSIRINGSIFSTYETGQNDVFIYKKAAPSSNPSILASNVNIDYNETAGTIESTINNPVVGGVLTAAKKTTADWLTLGSVSETNVPFTTTTNDGNEDREAIVTLTYTYGSPASTVTKDVTITQDHFVKDFVDLPFNWTGGTSATLTNLTGVTASGLGSDYAESNAPYRIKFDTTGDYIQFKTNEQPGTVKIDVKMIGGANTSKITVKESADGSTFTDVEELTISGSQNDVVNLETTKDFNPASRYVRLVFTRGSNVGVGPISITSSVVKTTTTTTIDATGITNTNLDEGTAAGQLTASVKAGDDPVVGATVTWTSDDESVATVDAGGNVTMKKKGTATITATYEGDETYASSSDTYVLNVTSEMQPTEVEATLNNSFFGSESTGNIDDAELSGAQDDVIVTITKNTGNKIYVNAAQIRLYKDNTMTLTAPAGYVLTSFEFVEPASDKSWSGNNNSANTGSYTDSNKSWTGTSNEVVITFGGTCRIGGLNITLALGTNVTDAKWATYVTPKDIDFAASTDVTAYKVTGTDGKIELEEVDAAPKGTPLVIAANESGYVFVEAASAPAAVTGNLLKAADGNQTGDGTGNFYVLGKDTENKVGFGPLANGVKLAIGKAYILGTDVTAKGFLPFVIGDEESETTSIRSIENSELRIENYDYFNLAGQKVSKDYKGIVVVNGKKFVRK